MGLKESLAGVGHDVIALARTRLELFSLEAAQQKSRVFKLLVMSQVAMVCLLLAMIILSVAIALAFWPTSYRFVALGVMVLVYFLVGVGLLVSVWRSLRHGPLPFAATLEELGHDVAFIDRIKEEWRAKQQEED